jgi:putative ABC transport system permease protein
LGNADWKIVGIFSDDGGVAESEVWADVRLVQQVWNRGATYQSVRARLTDESEATFKKFRDALTKDPQLQVDVKREPEFYAEQQKVMATLINGAGFVFAIMMGLAAIFAAVNTMLNAVASRVREIATLRAMGFGATPVVVSVLIEAMLLGAVGGLLGGVLAFVFLNGMQSSTMNFQSFSQITYAFTVTPQLMVTGIVYGLLLTFIAGVLPGIRAARLPITAGLREL